MIAEKQLAVMRQDPNRALYFVEWVPSPWDSVVPLYPLPRLYLPRRRCKSEGPRGVECGRLALPGLLTCELHCGHPRIAELKYTGPPIERFPLAPGGITFSEESRKLGLADARENAFRFYEGPRVRRKPPGETIVRVPPAFFGPP